MFNSLKSNIILTLFFFIQFLFRITSLKTGSTYMIIYYCSFGILNQSFIYLLRMTFSFVTVLVFVSYLTRMIFNLFSCVHVFNITMILVLESINSTFVTVLSSSFCMIIERVIKVPSPSFSLFLELSRFSTYRRL